MDSVQRGGLFVALLEITGGKASIQVNGKTYRKNSRLILSGGDEVIFGSSGIQLLIILSLDYVA